MKPVLLLITLLLLPALGLTQTVYRGETSLFEDTVWDGEILIDGILTVAAGATLEIRPGTTVRFTRFDSNDDQIGEHEIFVQGRLQARGTAEQPILFTSAENSPRPGDWGALNMMMGEDEPNLLEHCRVEYGYRGFHAHFSSAELRSSSFRHNLRGAQFQESEVLIEGCQFEENFNGLQFRDSQVLLRDSLIRDNNWGVRAVFVNLRIENCRIAGNAVNGVSLRDSDFVIEKTQIAENRRGIYLQRSRGMVLGNQVSHNLEHGIYLEDSIADLQDNLITQNGRSGLKVQHAEGVIEGNRFRENHQFAVVNDGPEDLLIGDNAFAPAPPLLLDGALRGAIGRIVFPANP